MTKKEILKDKYLKKTYGITLSDYNRMLVDQFNACAICKKNTAHFKNALAVDHDHGTGQVRGLLCFRCNKFVVGRNNPDSVRKLVEYILPEYRLVKKKA